MLIPGGRLQRLELTLAPLGMEAPWRCQGHYRPSSSSIGHGFKQLQTRNDSYQSKNIYILQHVHKQIPKTEMLPWAAYLFTNLPYSNEKLIDQVIL